MRYRITALQTLGIALLLIPAAWANDDVLTQHNDLGRTGAQLAETILKPANVTASTFGRLYERSVEGQIIAQPLYVSGLSIPGRGVRNIVFVATRKNWVYAFDADDLDSNPSGGLIWKIQIEPPGEVPGMCPETRGPMGITSTPVIDRAFETIYVTARNADGSIWLHALDIATGQAKNGTPGRVRIQANVQGINFQQGWELSRAALLFVDGAIYIGFSALNCDNAGWRGWVLAYRATDLQQVGAFVTALSPDGWGAGIWQSGNGLVSDGQGNIYFATGNGLVRGNTDLGESFVRLRAGPNPTYGLTLVAHYAVSNHEALNGGDTDLGSGGPILLPGGRLVGGGKQGKLYVLDSQSMQPTQNPPAPGPVPPGGSDGFQGFFNTWHNNAAEVICTNASILNRFCYMPHHRYEESELTGPNIHTGPIFWRGANASYGLLYGMPEKDYLRAFRYHNASHTLETSPAAISSVRSPDGMPGAFLSLSANGNTDGIIWASIPKYDGQWQNVPGRLVAFDALTLKELWRDDDDIAFPKFTPPTVAGGKLFRPTFADKLIVYGLKSAGTPTPCYTIAQKYQNFTGPEGILASPTGPESVAPDGIGHYRHFQGGSIYWTPSTCAQEVHGAIHGLWANLGWEAGVLGYPVTDETVTPDGIGRYNHFQRGSIYWTPLTGAHEVHGAIRSKWESLGWERSVLGCPISDETEEIDGSGRFNLFEHGSLHWNRTTGNVSMHADANLLIGPFDVNVDRPGADIANFWLPVANPALCQQRCADDTACRSWTYVNPGVQGSQAHCWLKNAMPVRQANGCCTSGIKVQMHPTNMLGMEGTVDRPGMDFLNFNLPDADPRLCQGECVNNAGCLAWTYLEPAHGNAAHCWLKNAIPGAVDKAETVSGLKGSAMGAIWRYAGTPCSGDSCPGWSRLDNNAKSVAIAAAGGSLYQLHHDGGIWRFTGVECSGSACPGWQRLDNNPKSVDVVAAGSQLYQLHNDGWIWQFTGQTCAGDTCPGWRRLDNNPKTVAITSAGTHLYQLHNDGWIWEYTGQPCSGDSCPGWRRIDNNAKTVALVAAGNELYQLHNDGWIWRFTGQACSGNTCSGWRRLDNNAKTIAIAAAGNHLYQLHHDGWIWQYTGQTCNGESCPGWRRLDNNPKSVALVAGGDRLYQLHNDGWIWEFTGQACNGDSCPGWRRLDNNSRSAMIVADESNLYQLHADPLYQIHDNGWIWRYTGPECEGSACIGWQALDSNPATIALSATGRQLFQLHRDGRIWRYSGTPCVGSVCTGWAQLDNNPATIGVTAGANQLFQLHRDGSIWRSTGAPCVGQSCAGWQQLDNNPATSAIVAGKRRVIQLHRDGSIWRSTGNPCNGNSCAGWQQLDNNPATRSIAADGNSVLQLHADGSIWRSTGAPCNGNSCPGWQRLDNNPSTVAIAIGNGRALQLHSDGSIWRSTGTPCNGNLCTGWERVDNNNQTVAMSASGRHLYQRHRNGRLWKYVGPACNGDSCPGWIMLDNNPNTAGVTASGFAD
jgi:hypothetical protein